MLRGFILGVIVSALAAAGAAYMVVVNGVIPAAADEPAGGLEKWVARNDLHAVLQADAPKGDNPIPLTDANLIAGVRLYADHCAICHGTSLGEASRSAIARGEAPSPPQLATHGVEDDPDGYTFWKIKHGIRFTGMPSWRDELSDQQIWTVALFLKHMDKLPPAPQAAWTSVVAPMPPGGQGPILVPPPRAPNATR
jgi:thiosulfate dehydrogenase